MYTETEFQLQASSSTEMLKMLIGAGLDRVQATNLLTGAEPMGQRPMIQDHRMNQGSSARVTEDQGIHQSVQSGSQFKHTVLQTLKKFRREIVLHMRNMDYKWNSRCGAERIYMHSTLITG